MKNISVRLGVAGAVGLFLAACATQTAQVPEPVIQEATSSPEPWTAAAWTDEQAHEYAATRDLFETRDREMFEGDLQMVGMLDQLLGLTPVPSPVRPYGEHDGVNNCFVANMAIFDRAVIGDQTLRIQGRTLAYSDPTASGSDTA